LTENYSSAKPQYFHETTSLPTSAIKNIFEKIKKNIQDPPKHFPGRNIANKCWLQNK